MAAMQSDEAFRISGKSGRSYEAGLLYGDGSYFRHPYGNRPNFLLELLQAPDDQDIAKAPETNPGKLAVWLVFVCSMVAIAVIIIFLSEASKVWNSSTVPEIVFRTKFHRHNSSHSG